MINCIINDDYRNILPKLPSESINLVLTDPPYGIQYQNHFTNTKHEVLKGDEKPFNYDILAYESYRLLKYDTAILCYTGWSTYPIHYNQIKAEGFVMKEPLIIQKRAGGVNNLENSFQPNVDWCLFAQKGEFTFRRPNLLRNKKAYTVPNKGRKEVEPYKNRLPSCWFGIEYPYSTENPSFKHKFNIKHATVKTVECMEWLIKLTTDVGDTILDPFVGSGSVAIACKKTNRNYICCDIDSDNCELTEHRLKSNEIYIKSDSDLDDFEKLLIKD